MAVTEATTSATISINTQYRIETRLLIDNAAGAMELRLYLGDSTTPIETLLLDAQDTLNSDVLALTLQNSSGGALVYTYDDVAINDDTGTFQNSWPGPEKIVLISESADNVVAWTKGGTAPAATNWQGVDDVPGTPDDNTAYNFEPGTTNEDRLVLSSVPAEVPSNATLTLLDVYARVAASSSSGTMALKVWDNAGTGTEGPTFTVSTSTWRILTTAEHQVYDLTGVGTGLFGQYNIGYIAKSGSVEKRITALWANLAWVPTSSTTTLFIATNPMNGMGCGGRFFAKSVGVMEATLGWFDRRGKDT